jgi:hypothetical protein
MPHGKASRKRHWQQATKAKAAVRKAEKRAGLTPTMESQPRQLTIPTITEVISSKSSSLTVSTNHGKDDLLSFQFAHFGDNTKPDAFFVDPEQAVNYCPDFEEFGDDGLGWYDDGVKRTITDEQIAMFRHTEIEKIMRKRRMQAEEEVEDDDDDDFYEPPGPDAFDTHTPEPGSPVSDASSLELELFSSVATSQPRQHKPQLKPKKQCSQSSSRSEKIQRKRARSPRSRQRKTEVPYDQRNKRKWESYIENEDPLHGSITHRRMVRELDGQKTDAVTMEYGDDEAEPLKPAPSTAAMPGRRIISYEDD